MIIQPNDHLDGEPTQSLASCDEVRRWADLLLQSRIRFVHDHGIDSDTRHHRKRLRLAVVHAELDQVDRPVVPAERNPESLVGIQGQLEVPGRISTSHHRSGCPTG
jgi:hypothetical protein